MKKEKTVCPQCGEELILDPIHGKLMVHKDAGNYFCVYGQQKRNAA